MALGAALVMGSPQASHWLTGGHPKILTTPRHVILSEAKELFFCFGKIKSSFFVGGASELGITWFLSHMGHGPSFRYRQQFKQSAGYDRRAYQWVSWRDLGCKVIGRALAPIKHIHRGESCDSFFVTSYTACV